MYRSIVFLLAAVLTTTAAEAAKIYKWVDENGVTQFSTSPPPRENADKTTLQGGILTQPRSSTESQNLANIKRKDLTNSGWQGCESSLCQLVQQIDPDCQTSFCSRAKRYSSECTSAACQTKKLTFEKDMRDRLAAQNELRQRQAINANATPTAPTPQNQD
jgi:Domain of unknown function (DUF4124)